MIFCHFLLLFENVVTNGIIAYWCWYAYISAVRRAKLLCTEYM